MQNSPVLNQNVFEVRDSTDVLLHIFDYQDGDHCSDYSDENDFYDEILLDACFKSRLCGSIKITIN